MENVLLIHIGMSKTGTSALQSFLYNNMEKLEEYGWCYPDFSQELFGIPFVSKQKEINGGVFYKERGKFDKQSENWIRAWKLILRILRRKNVIVSEERICIWNTNELLKAAKEEYNNIKVIIYLRRQDKAIESMWNQRVKNPIGCYQTFQEFIHVNAGVEYSYCYYKKQLDEISKIIGKENLIVRVYEKEQLCGAYHTTESDFMSVLGIEPDWKDWKKSRIPNYRLDENYLEIKRIFNSIRLVCGDDLVQGQYWQYFKELSRTFGKARDELGYFTIEERQNFLKKFAFENEMIAREYLNRKDGVLFYNNRMDYPLHTHQYSSFEEDMVRLFSLLLCNQNKEIQQLKKYNCILAEKLLSYTNFQEKKLLLFGAGCKCRELLNTLKMSVVLIVDNDEAKSGKKLKGVDIICASEIKNWSEYFTIVTCVKTDEIEKQLQMYGLKKEKDYILAKEYFACY